MFRKKMCALALSWAAIMALPFATGWAADNSGAPFVVAETGKQYALLSDAVADVGNGQATIWIAAGTYRQCAVQTTGEIAFRAVQPGTAIFDGAICEGKAALVLKGRSALVDGLVFRNLRVPDGNGAGIRLQSGDLTVTRSLFEDSEEGILTHDDADHDIRIDQSTFRHLGRCDRDLACAHSIYVGHYGSLSVTNSRFEAGTGGHYIKTRSTRVSIAGNSFDDSRGHLTNYMIDLANGASGLIIGNEMEQGHDKDNYSLFISIAPEGRENDSSDLLIRDNVARFVPGLERRSSFVANWTNDPVVVIDNHLADGIAAITQR